MEIRPPPARTKIGALACYAAAGGSNRSSKSRSVSLVGMFRPELVVHNFKPPLVTIAVPRSRSFLVNGTRVQKKTNLSSLALAS